MAQVDLAQFHGIFFEESREGLDAMESALLNLDTGRVDAELVDTIFRAAHSIKGGAATFGFHDVAAFTHVAEELLDEIRSHRRQVTVDAVELLLHCVDCLRGMLDRAQRGEASMDASSEALLAELHTVLGCRTSPAAPAPSGEDSKESSLAPAAQVEQASYWEILFRPKAGLLRSGNDPLRIFRELEALGDLSADVDPDAVPAFSELDPEICYLVWDLHLTGSAGRAAIEAAFEWAAEDCELEIRRPDMAPALPPAKASAPSTALRLPEAQPQLSTLPAVIPPAGEARPAAAAAATVATTTVATPTVATATETGSIRVGIEKVDALINMVGELVITQSMLDRYRDHFDMSSIESLRAGLAQLERNTRELQESVMQIRMLPIGFVFNRFPRLVRDLSSKLGKQVRLELAGEQTELDKTVLEKIGDPLVHLVRNAIDHGLETPERRLAAGKPATGTLRMHAYHQGGHITVEVSDDGAGLNRSAIGKRAIERGLIAAADGLSDEEMAELIFMPGFSTVEATTDLSGRGVGMDVVRRNVSQLGGSVGVVSRPGAGSTFTITLPLTLAIMDGLTAAVGEETYIVPLVSVVESLQLDKNRITRIGSGRRVFRFRDEVLPIIALHDVFGCRNPIADEAEGIVIVAEGDGTRAGLLVDALVGQQQAVIKSLETNYRRVEGISGATILGDGTIALIVDVGGLVRLAHRKRAA